MVNWKPMINPSHLSRRNFSLSSLPVNSRGLNYLNLLFSSIIGSLVSSPNELQDCPFQSCLTATLRKDEVVDLIRYLTSLGGGGAEKAPAAPDK